MLVLIISALLVASSTSLQTLEITNGEVWRDGPNLRMFEQQLNETIEQLQEILREGYPPLGVPPCDPLKIDFASFQADIHQIIKANFWFSNIIVKNIPDFVATDLKFDLFKLSLDVTLHFPYNEITGRHESDGVLVQFIPIDNNGTFTIRTKDLIFDVKILLAAPLAFKDLLIVTSVGDVNFELTGVLGNEEFSQALSNTLNQHVGQLLNDNKEDIAKLVSPILMKFLNNLIN